MTVCVLRKAPEEETVDEIVIIRAIGIVRAICGFRCMTIGIR